MCKKILMVLFPSFQPVFLFVHIGLCKEETHCSDTEELFASRSFKEKEERMIFHPIQPVLFFLPYPHSPTEIKPAPLYEIEMNYQNPIATNKNELGPLSIKQST